jgi:uncharacterized protein (UPF0179 family)|tara:strand:+ start:798 stop:1058 length:261 start_codon:yes stop_codon:yes gene_type:complete
MIKVEKTTLIEMNVEFKQIFDGATIEEATEKAHSQESPSETAKCTIAGQRFLNAKIKQISDTSNDDRTKTNPKSRNETAEDGGKNV